MKLKRLRKAINDTKELHEATFENGIIPRKPPNRAKGRPTYKWANRALEEYWEDLQKRKPEIANTPFNIENTTIRNIIIKEAKEAIDT